METKSPKEGNCLLKLAKAGKKMVIKSIRLLCFRSKSANESSTATANTSTTSTEVRDSSENDDSWYSNDTSLDRHVSMFDRRADLIAFLERELKIKSRPVEVSAGEDNSIDGDNSIPVLNEKYHVTSILGRGGNGVVYAATRWEDGLPVAIKRILPGSFCLYRGKDGRPVLFEAAVMEYLNARFISAKINGNRVGVAGSPVPRLLSTYHHNDSYYIVTERSEDTCDLQQFCRASNGHGLSERLARHFFLQMHAILAELMAANVYHGDIKDNNFVVDMSGGSYNLQIIDFGAADWHNNNDVDGDDGGYRFTFRGIDLFCPPEWFQSGRFRVESLTTFNLGVMLYTMLTGGRPPFYTPSDTSCGAFDMPARVSPAGQEVLRRCLARQDDRVSFSDVLNLAWCKEKVNLKKVNADADFVKLAVPYQRKFIL